MMEPLEPTSDELERFWCALIRDNQEARFAEQRIQSILKDYADGRALSPERDALRVRATTLVGRRIPFSAHALLKHRLARGFDRFVDWIRELGRPDLVTAEMIDAAEVDRAMEERRYSTVIADSVTALGSLRSPNIQNFPSRVKAKPKV